MPSEGFSVVRAIGSSDATDGDAQAPRYLPTCTLLVNAAESDRAESPFFRDGQAWKDEDGSEKWKVEGEKLELLLAFEALGRFGWRGRIRSTRLGRLRRLKGLVWVCVSHPAHGRDIWGQRVERVEWVEWKNASTVPI